MGSCFFCKVDTKEHLKSCVSRRSTMKKAMKRAQQKTNLVQKLNIRHRFVVEIITFSKFAIAEML